MPRDGRFIEIALDEPPKDAVMGRKETPRRAAAVIYDGVEDHTFEAIANLSTGKVDSWKTAPGVQPSLTARDTEITELIVRRDSRFLSAMKLRGITDLDAVRIDVWPAGFFGRPGAMRGRMVRAIFFMGGKGTNHYAHPIEGLVAHVNLTAAEVIDFADLRRDTPIPQSNGEYTQPASGPPRKGLPAFEIRQPRGSGFALENGEVRWEKWRFRFGLHPREGLVLHTVGYEDAGRVRGILYRGSLSEMVVPYGDPDGAWFFRNSFDAGELGLGASASELRPGIECPDNCRVFDGAVTDGRGGSLVKPGAIALYERDGGIAWKHGDEARRSRELVAASISKVGNYDYGLEWVFHQDGSLEVRVLLTGIMSLKAVREGMHDGHSHPVAPGLAAPHHQHFFAFRLDMDVDGASPNRLVEINSAPDPGGSGNPQGGAFSMTETVLQAELQARRNLNPASDRRWVVVNPGVRKGHGQGAGYALLPGENTHPYAAPNSWIRKRAGFLEAQVWATPYHPLERYAAGDYPNQSHGGDGLPKWTAGNRAVDGGDLVLWYVMGITHNPRPEDWPVMPSHVAGFKLVPWGYFDRNPALDLPAAGNVR